MTMQIENGGAQTQETEVKDAPKAAPSETQKLSKQERRARAREEAKKNPPAPPKDAPKDEKKDTKQTDTKSKEKALDKKNVEQKAEQVKDLLYIYPKDVTSQDQKKTWRRKQRASVKSYLKQIETLKASTKKEDIAKRKEIEAEYTKYRKEVFTKG